MVAKQAVTVTSTRVNYATADAFRSAPERRLVDRSKEGGVALVRLRKAVVFDRLLARLVAVAGGRWLLKGALALVTVS